MHALPAARVSILYCQGGAPAAWWDEVLFSYLTKRSGGHIIYLTRQPVGECTSPVPVNIRLKNSRQLTRAGRLFFMGIVQNGYDQHGNAQDDLEFFVCTHKAPPLSARLGTGWEHVPRFPG